MPHPDEGLIHAWLDGELDPAEAARVEALVAADPEWSAAAAEARGLIAASAGSSGRSTVYRRTSSPRSRRAAARPAPRRWLWRAAAVLALVAGSAVVLRQAAGVAHTGRYAGNGPAGGRPRRAGASAAVPAGGNAVAAGSPARRPAPDRRHKK